MNTNNETNPLREELTIWLLKRIEGYREYLSDHPEESQIYNALISELETVLITQVQAALHSPAASDALKDDKGILIGTFTYDHQNGTETYTPASNSEEGEQPMKRVKLSDGGGSIAILDFEDDTVSFTNYGVVDKVQTLSFNDIKSIANSIQSPIPAEQPEKEQSFNERNSELTERIEIAMEQNMSPIEMAAYLQSFELEKPEEKVTAIIVNLPEAKRKSFVNWIVNNTKSF